MVWNLVRKLLDLTRSLLVEIARNRFRTNFGTEVCERCEGLHAGENVAATCFQTKLCYYGNVKRDPSPKQKGVIDDLTGQKRM